MNFSHLPSQLIAILLGWIFTLFLQYRANVRAESIRKKDKIIERIDKLVDWAEKSTAQIADNPNDVEEIYAAMVSQIEIRITNLNSLLRPHSVQSGSLVQLRSVDILDADSSGEPIKQLRMAAVSLAEDLELACDSRYFSREPIPIKLKRHASELLGVAAAFLALLSLLALISAARYVLF